jgi:hypothetical protein
LLTFEAWTPICGGNNTPHAFNDAPQGGFFLCNQPRVPFENPAITLEQQVAVLAERGMLVPDVARAPHYLQFIG